MKPKALNKTAFLRVLTIGCLDEIEQHDVNYKMFLIAVLLSELSKQLFLPRISY